MPDQISYNLIQPAQLANQLNKPDQVIVDLSKNETFIQGHIAGARHIDYAQVVKNNPPVMGLLPEPDAFAKTLAAAGITPDTYVIAYDDEGGGKAARLLWTLEAAGHRKLCLLDGGLHAWTIEGLPTTRELAPAPVSEYPVSYKNNSVLADADYILEHLHDPQIVFLDARSRGEFEGTDVRASRVGHIPGAVHFDWMEGIDRDHGLRMKTREQLSSRFEELGIHPDKEIVVYCHSHHRSAHTYYLLKVSGFKRVRGYAGAWSDWANRQNTPVEK